MLTRPQTHQSSPSTHTSLLTLDNVGAGPAPRQNDPLSTQPGLSRGRRHTSTRRPDRSGPPAVILALLLFALLCVLAPHRAQAQQATWDGTVLAKNTSLHIGPGERTTHYIKLSKKPSVNGVEIEPGDEWHVFLYINGTRSKQWWYRDLDIVPSMFRRFYFNDWNIWKGFSIYRLTDAEWQARKGDDVKFPGIDDDTPRATSVRFTHEVWDHNNNCPVHNVGPVTLGNSGGNSGNNGNNNNPDSPNDANDLNDPDNSNNPNVPNVPDAPDAPNVVTVDTNENGGSGRTDSTVTTPPGGSYTFTPDDFADTGGDPFECVRIVTLPGDGMLTLNGVAVNAGDEISRSDIDAGLLVFTPDDGGSGSPYTSFDFQAGGCDDLENEPTRTIIIDLPDESETPEGPDGTIATPPDSPYTFTPDDFADTGGDPFECVRIVTLPGDGMLTLNGVAVNAGDEISRSDIDAGLLVFTPDDGGSGSPYTSFDFQAGDCGDLEDEPTHTIIINVPEPTVPGASDDTVTTSSDGTYTFSADDFADGLFECIGIVSLPVNGVLTLNGVAVSAGDEIRKSDIDAGRLVFTPDEGESGSAYTSFTFRAGDCGDLMDEPIHSITIDVPNPAPQAPAPPIVTPTEGSTTSLDVTWVAPDNTHCPGPCPEITHYDLQYRRGMDGVWGDWIDGPRNVTVTNTTISVPDLMSPYQVRVRAVNAEGTDGAWSQPGLWSPTRESVSRRPMRIWLARFGRTIADQMIDAVGTRLQAPVDTGGLKARIAGRSLAGTQDKTTGIRNAVFPYTPVEGDVGFLPGVNGPEYHYPNFDRYDAWYGAGEDTVPGVHSRKPGGREVLRNSSFSYSGGDTRNGMPTVWVRGAATAFDGHDRINGLDVDGEVESMLLGTDFRQAKSVFGALLAHSSGKGDYRAGSDGTVRIDLSLTGIYPYASHETDRYSVWGIAGYGGGEVIPTREGKESAPADMDLLMAAGGIRSRLPKMVLDNPLIPAVDWVADVMSVRVNADGEESAGLKTRGDVSRVQMGLEAGWDPVKVAGGWLRPIIGLGFRADTGDAERGIGSDIEGRLRWVDPTQGIQVQLQAHGLLSHEDGEFRERGLSGSVSWDPDSGSRRGAAISLTSSVSDAATRGLDSFPLNPGDRDVLAGLVETGDDDRHSNAQVQVKAGYGFGVFEDRLTGIPEFGVTWSGDSRKYSAGWRLLNERSGAFEIQLEATHRRFMDNGGSDDGIGMRLGAYW